MIHWVDILCWEQNAILVEFRVDMTFSKNKSAVDCRLIEGFQSLFWVEQGWTISHRHRKTRHGPSLIFRCIKRTGCA